MNEWTLVKTESGICMKESKRRSNGSKKFTWANLIYKKLASVEVFIIYFPSRFELEVDDTVKKIITKFGENTGATTSVNIWDVKDPKFSKALLMFNLKTPPALVIASGLKAHNSEPYGPDRANIYSIAIDDTNLLGNPEKLMPTLSYFHEVIAKGNSKEISACIRKKSVDSFLVHARSIVGGFKNAVSGISIKMQLPDGSVLEVVNGKE